MARTGLPSQRSAWSATSTIDRLVPHCTMASMSSPSISLSTSTRVSGVTSAMDVAESQRRPRTRLTSYPHSVKYP